jgi:hypothetical protein
LKALISALNSDYELPSRSALSETLVPNMALKMEQDMANELKNSMYCTLVCLQILGHQKRQKTMRQFLFSLLKRIINFDPIRWVNTIQSLAFVAVYISLIQFYYLLSFCNKPGIGQLEDATALGHFEFIRDLLEKHDGLRQKVVSICTDNAEVMKRTASLLKFLDLAASHTT